MIEWCFRLHSTTQKNVPRYVNALSVYACVFEYILLCICTEKAEEFFSLFFCVFFFFLFSKSIESTSSASYSARRFYFHFCILSSTWSCLGSTFLFAQSVILFILRHFMHIFFISFVVIIPLSLAMCYVPSMCFNLCGFFFLSSLCFAIIMMLFRPKLIFMYALSTGWGFFSICPRFDSAFSRT